MPRSGGGSATSPRAPPLDIDGLGGATSRTSSISATCTASPTWRRLTLDDFLEIGAAPTMGDGITPGDRCAGQDRDEVGRNLIGALARSRHTTLARLLFALGIRHVGESTAKTLADCSVRSNACATRRHRAARCPIIGPGVAEAIDGSSFQPGNQRRSMRCSPPAVQPADEHPPAAALAERLNPVALARRARRPGSSAKPARRQLAPALGAPGYCRAGPARRWGAPRRHRTAGRAHLESAARLARRAGIPRACSALPRFRAGLLALLPATPVIIRPSMASPSC